MLFSNGLPSHEVQVTHAKLELDRDVINLRTDLTNFRAEVSQNSADVHRNFRWLNEKWVEHDKAIHRISEDLGSH